MDFKRKIKKLPVICILLISLFCFASLKTFKTKAENTEDKQLVKTFSDIQDHKAKETIEKLASQGIISGIDENRFAPDQKIKRAEYVDWIIKALGLDETKYKDCFKDVKSDNKYAEVLQTAFDKKLIDPGMLDQGNFKPDAPVSREELASFNVKAFRFKTKNNSVIGNLDRYEDANLISKWAVDSAKTAVALGLIKTVSSTKFSPADAMSRADAAIHIDILLSLLSDYLSGNHPDLIPDMPDIKPLINVKMRDTSICVGGDGMYYLTGSTGENIWDHNDGIELWRSADLKKWEYLGLVWSIEKDGTWQKEWGTLHDKPIRSIWAPEIHYLKGNYWLTYSVPTKGSGLLKSATGKPEGPYINALKYDQPLIGNIDPSLFEDDDGKVYFVYCAGSIARMNDDMSGLVETPRPVTLINPDREPSHHASKDSRGEYGDIGNEGAFLFKANGKYYMSCADSYHGRYSSMVAVADNVYGPYTLRHEAVPCGGHNTYFKDNNGQWWSTFFGNDNFAPFREKPAIVPINFGADGKIHVIINNTGSSSFWNKKTIIATTGMLALLLAIVIYVLYKIKHVKKKTV